MGIGAKLDAPADIPASALPEMQSTSEPAPKAPAKSAAKPIDVE
jgi:hypothetical protein